MQKSIRTMPVLEILIRKVSFLSLGAENNEILQKSNS